MKTTLFERLKDYAGLRVHITQTVYDENLSELYKDEYRYVDLQSMSLDENNIIAINVKDDVITLNNSSCLEIDLDKELPYIFTCISKYKDGKFKSILLIVDDYHVDEYKNVYFIGDKEDWDYNHFHSRGIPHLVTSIINSYPFKYGKPMTLNDIVELGEKEWGLGRYKLAIERYLPRLIEKNYLSYKEINGIKYYRLSEDEVSKYDNDKEFENKGFCKRSDINDYRNQWNNLK